MTRSMKPLGKLRSKASSRTKAKNINIFISYASEDKDLIASIAALLNETFLFSPAIFYRDVEIREGNNYAKAIDEALNKADILLVVFTERMKMSHSYTGYEVGFFQRSIQEQPVSKAGFRRIYIPFCIGAEIPDTMHYIQGVSVEKTEAYKVLKTSVVSGIEPAIDTGHPVYRLLQRIAELIIRTVGPVKGGFAPERIVKLERPASALYKIIHEYLQGRISSETYPERKIIIRSATRPKVETDGINLKNASVELVGDFAEVFAIPLSQSTGREYTWAEFEEKIPIELRNNSVIGICQLATAMLTRSGDNYHVVTTLKRDKSFRLFVSKVITYVSEKTEIDIYMVQTRTKEYGDPVTTRLLKAISAGLKFRFLVLEEQSDFRPEKLGHPIVTPMEFKAKVAEMMGQIDLILKEAAEANLYDPEMLILIWGPGQEQKVKNMMDLWNETIEKLTAAAQKSMSLSDDRKFEATRANFITTLINFCNDIEEMNREFTSRVLALLADRVKCPPQAMQQKPLSSGSLGDV